MSLATTPMKDKIEKIFDDKKLNKAPLQQIVDETAAMCDMCLTYEFIDKSVHACDRHIHLHKLNEIAKAVNKIDPTDTVLVGKYFTYLKDITRTVATTLEKNKKNKEMRYTDWVVKRHKKLYAKRKDAVVNTVFDMDTNDEDVCRETNPHGAKRQKTA
ncbi:MAG: hypothetical protein Faunusvirus10_21 [Faunusvirus sp.]|jgi:hypothetical protein|uniref:Uncharacterized protein n=1 Tax=Faunusvirus sp. TaxID=2487766 RepID=A0A3G4ZWS2_9VIRU|nr:MAG: hypothetical protein Faunusvirus10_21 [Faunusvirus sp.]